MDKPDIQKIATLLVDLHGPLVGPLRDCAIRDIADTAEEMYNKGQDSLRAQLADAQTEHQLADAAFFAEREKWAEERDQLKAEIERLNEELANAHSDVMALKEDRTNAEAEVERLRAEVIESGGGFKALYGAKTELKRMFKAAAAERDQLRAECEKLRSCVVGQQGIIEKAWTDNEQLKKDNSELYEAGLKQKSEINRLNRILARELRESDELGNEFSYVLALKDKLAEAEKRHDRLTTDLVNREAKLSLALEALERIGVAKGYDNLYGDALGGFLMNEARTALHKIKGEG